MNNGRSIVQAGAVLVISSILTTTAEAQKSAASNKDADLVAIELAAMQYVASDPATRGSLLIDGPNGVVFDERVAHRGENGRSKRPTAHAQHLAQTIGKPLVDGDSVLGCTSTSGHCRLLPGGPALVGLGQTSIQGDSAFIKVTTLLPPASTSSREPFHRVQHDLLLRRAGNTWRVVPEAGSMTRS